ncbi:MAG: hypothetical protein HFE90_08820 [Firmicutes bacterium]|nr:hypothetical protein [Bacillota bacterium]
MNNENKQIVVNALIKVMEGAPGSNSQKSYQNDSQVQYQDRDVSAQKFSIWLNYVNKVLDISYSHIGFNDILETKIRISRLSSEVGLSNKQRVTQIYQEIFNLAQKIAHS